MYNTSLASNKELSYFKVNVIFLAAIDNFQCTLKNCKFKKFLKGTFYSLGYFAKIHSLSDFEDKNI